MGNVGVREEELTRANPAEALPKVEFRKWRTLFPVPVQRGPRTYHWIGLRRDVLLSTIRCQVPVFARKVSSTGRPLNSCPVPLHPGQVAIPSEQILHRPEGSLKKLLPRAGSGNPHGEASIDHESFARDIVVGDELED